MTATPMVGSTFFGLDISQVAAQLLSLRRKISKRVLLLEFGPASLLMAEATLTQAGVQLSHVSFFSLPPEALDRGVPAEPLKMARLIQDFCADKKIPAHRVAVILPPELAFQRLLELPVTLTTDEAREYVLNPANGLQIPFPLTQTDFDLFPVTAPAEQSNATDKRLYMLSAIPEVLVDPIVEMLQAADLELQLLELGSHCQLRNHAAELVTLGSQQVDLVLELLPDCSNLMLVCCSGLLGSERLAAIRNLPALDLDPEQLSVAVGSGLLAEDLLFKDENYLPISDLDLRVLVSDLKASFERFYQKLPDVQIRRLILTGVNSSHPLLSDLLAEMLGLPVVLARSSSVTGLVGLSMDDLLLHSTLGRLTGLALGILPNDQLLACSLDVHGVADEQSQHRNDAVAIADLLSSSQAQTGLDLVALEASSSVVLTDSQTDNDSGLSVDVPMAFDEPMNVSCALPPATDQTEQLPTRLDVGISAEDEPLEIVLEEICPNSASDHGWPSIAASSVEDQSDSDVVDVGDSSDEQWPSLNSSTSGGMDDSLHEKEWPSIASITQDENIREEALDAEDEPSQCSSISLDGVLDARVSGDVVEISEELAVGDNDPIQDVDADQMTASSSFDQSSNFETSSSEDLHPVDPPDLVRVGLEESLVIPDLPLSQEPVEKQNQSTHEESSSDDSMLADEATELGELRFASDEN